MMFNNKGLKKVTKRDRYGNQMTYEFEAPQKPLDPTAIIKHQMDKEAEVPEIEVIGMEGFFSGGGEADGSVNHPGEPKGTDTVPAWLTPGEFVMNAEATEMFKPLIEKMNEQGRMMQKSQGGPVPRYESDGGSILDGVLDNEYDERMLKQYEDAKRWIPEDQVGSDESYDRIRAAQAARDLDYDEWLRRGIISGGLPSNSKILRNSQYKSDGGYASQRGSYVTDEMLDALRFIESSDNPNAVNKRSGASGAYQFMPQFFEKGEPMGYGVPEGPWDPFDEEESRMRARKYLQGMEARNPNWSREDLLRAYNWGPGNVAKHKAGTRTDMPEEAQHYPHKIMKHMSRDGESYFNTGGVITGVEAPPLMEDEMVPVVDPVTGYEYGSEAELLAAQEARRAENEAMLAEPEVPEVEQPVPTTLDTPEAAAEFYSKQIRNGQMSEEIARNALHSQFPNLRPGQAQALLPSQAAPESELGAAITDETLAAKKSLAGATKDEELMAEVQKEIDERANPLVGSSPAEIAGEREIPRINAPEVKEYVEEKAIESEQTPEQQQQDVDTMVAETEADQQSRQESEEIDNIDNGTQLQAGQDAADKDPKAFSAVTDAFSKAFGRLLSSDRLAEAAIMYLGSRALGYSHGGSMNWAAKNYLQQVQGDNQAKTAAKAEVSKRAYELAKTDKFTPASVRAFRASGGDEGLLISKDAAGGSKIDFTKPEIVYNNGKKLELYPAESANGSKVWVDKSGRPVGPQEYSTFETDPYKVRGTKEYNSRVNDYRRISEDQIKSLRTQFGVASKTDDGITYKTDINPATQAGEIAKWAAENGVAAEDLAGLVESAYHDAINTPRQDGTRVRDLTTYMNDLIIRKSVGNPDLFKNDDGHLISSRKLAKVNNAIEVMGKVPPGANIKAIADQYYNAAALKWNELGPEGQAKYNNRANADENGFYVFIANDLKVDNRMAKK